MGSFRTSISGWLLPNPSNLCSSCRVAPVYQNGHKGERVCPSQLANSLLLPPQDPMPASGVLSHCPWPAIRAKPGQQGFGDLAAQVPLDEVLHVSMVSHHGCVSLGSPMLSPHHLQRRRNWGSEMENNHLRSSWVSGAKVSGTSQMPQNEAK